jgi:hypothetical protein
MSDIQESKPEASNEHESSSGFRNRGGNRGRLYGRGRGRGGIRKTSESQDTTAKVTEPDSSSVKDTEEKLNEAKSDKSNVGGHRGRGGRYMHSNNRGGFKRQVFVKRHDSEELADTSSSNNIRKSADSIQQVQQGHHQAQRPVSAVTYSSNGLNPHHSGEAVKSQVLAELVLELEVGRFLIPVYKETSPVLQVQRFIRENHLSRLLPIDLLEKYQVSLASYIQEIQTTGSASIV